MPTIKYAADEQAIATITFNRDAKRNAFNREMSELLLRELGRAERDQARVVVLRANHAASVWCAGHDLEELDPETLDTNPMIEIFWKIQSMPLPVIAMVEGSVHAGGLMMLLGADIVIAATNTESAITSNKLGIPLPPEVFAFWLRVMGLHKAKELLFTAGAISAEDAANAGLYNHVVDVERIESFTYEMAHKIISCDPAGIANTKHQLNLIAQKTSLTADDLADIHQRRWAILNSPETRSRIAKFLASLRG